MTTKLSNVTLQLPVGVLTARDLSANAEISKSQLAQQVLQPHPVPFTSLRVWDSLASLPVTAAAADDLALITGTPGTDAPTISSGDLKAAGATSRKIAFEMEVPANFDDGQTLEVRIRAGMKTTIADGSATVDLEVFKADEDGLVGADICSTAPQSINSLTLADKDFTLATTTIDPGDRLLCVVTVAVNDAATGTAVEAIVTSIQRRCDTRG